MATSYGVKLLAQWCDVLGYGKRSNRYAAVGYGVYYLLKECGERSTRGKHVVDNEDMFAA